MNGEINIVDDPSRETGTLLALLYIWRRRKRRRTESQRRRYWVCPTIRRRREQGAWENLVQELIIDEPEKFLNFHRLTIEEFHILLGKIEHIVQRSTLVREPIPAGLKLSLTLRYLASGESMVSLSYQYRIGLSTVSTFIPEVCEAIWSVLQPEYLQPPTAEKWRKIAEDFYNTWNFPNCVGSIDGKHVVVQCFANTGSDFYNHKGTFSTSMLACCDAQYRFTFVSIGSRGRESDGGIFNTSDMGQAILRQRLPLPPPRLFDGFPTPLPPVFLGDQAFPLLPQLMRPFAVANNADRRQIIYNYRHSRCRRVIENCFEILASRFRIFRRPIVAKVETVDKIVQATVVLHNWVRTRDIDSNNASYSPAGFADWEDANGTLHEGQWRQEPQPDGLVPIPRNTATNATELAKTIREQQALYFLSNGELEWQWQHLPILRGPL